MSSFQSLLLPISMDFCVLATKATISRGLLWCAVVQIHPGPSVFLRFALAGSFRSDDTKSTKSRFQ
jgi:hypothetical protein